jgi:predicted metalloprotease
LSNMRPALKPARNVVLLSLLAFLCSAVPCLAAAQTSPSEAQLSASDAKIHSAAAVIDGEWARVFTESGDHYSSPQITGYLVSVNTPCGVLDAGNAYACRANGSIYYDRAFLASLMANAASALGTDGDVAAIFPIAHEWGHAVQYMLKLDYTSSPSRIESDADCLAGAILGISEKDGHLERGDIEEAEYALNMAGDPPLVTGIWGATIEKMNREAGAGTTPVITNAVGGHGNHRERVAAFHNGMTNGVRRCIQGIPIMSKSMRSPWLPPLP